jgi:uncharacterized membrane protein HdeD (DUF308 family)
MAREHERMRGDRSSPARVIVATALSAWRRGFTQPGEARSPGRPAAWSASGTRGKEHVMAEGMADDFTVARDAARDVSGFWWLWLISGAAWLIVAAIVLQFDQASVKTVGIVIGLMFLFTGVQQFILAGVADGWTRWISVFFGVLLVVAGVISLVNPKDTFAGFADILGFLFLVIATMWIVEAFVAREVDDLWWLTLIAGILMVILAFWTSGQFFIHKAYVLLVFAGIWALMQGVTDIVRAFQVRRMHRALD